MRCRKERRRLHHGLPPNAKVMSTSHHTHLIVLDPYLAALLQCGHGGGQPRCSAPHAARRTQRDAPLAVARPLRHYSASPGERGYYKAINDYVKLLTRPLPQRCGIQAKAKLLGEGWPPSQAGDL